MRVLHVNSGRLYGGVEVVLESLHRHRALAPAMEAEHAVCFEGRSAERLEALGATVHRLGPARASRPWSVLRARRALRGVLARGGFDAVVCHLAWAAALFGAPARAAGARLAYWYHDPTDHPRQFLDAWARRTRPDLLICTSRYTAGRMARYYPRTPREVLYNPVAAPAPRPEGERAAARAELGVADPATAVVLQVARWQPHKGYHLHVEALGRLAGLGGWAAWFVGEPQRPAEAAYRDEVRALAGRLGVADRVHFLGWQADLDRLRGAADLYCQPNAAPEPFGLAYVEALHAGLPVVATRLGGPAETVDATCGVLVEPGDGPGLAGALGRLIADPSERARLGAAGPARAAALCDPSASLGRLARLLGARPGAGAAKLELSAGPPGPYPVL